ncbi:MAG: chromosome segregation protein SMC, partial [Methylococcales bacterium]|nr:chromosome segregation protein SMC [Methylococcales bacterium]
QKTVDETHVIESLTLQANEITQQISEAQFLRNTLEKAIINEQLLQKMQQQRTHLEHDKSCPLCGSLDHPFAKKPPRSTDSQQALKEQTFKLKALVSQADKLKNTIFNAEKQKLKNIDKGQNIQKNQSHWRILSNKLNVVGKNMAMDNFGLMKKLLKQEETELKVTKKKLVSFQNQQISIQKLNSKLDYQNEQGQRLKDELSEQTTQVTRLPKQLEQLKAHLKKTSEDEKDLSFKTLHQLEALGEKMPVQGQDEALKQRLEVYVKDYKNYQQQQQSIQKTLKTLTEKRTEYQSNVKQLSDTIEQNSTVLAKEEVVGLLLSQIEKQDTIIEEKQSFEKASKKYTELEKTLTAQLHESPFANISDIKEALVLLDQEEAIAKKYADFQQQAAFLETEQQQLQVKLAEKKRLAHSEDKLETLNRQNKALTEKISIASAEIRTLKNKQQTQQSSQQRQEQLNEKLQQQQQKFTEASENLQQSQDNGVVFRRRVQLKMATQLLSQTNSILEKTSGRYYLRQAPSENGLALEIEDTKLQNSRRSPKSLSGGERFVISLALALGLSELANNGKSVGFLFLDEGFGNLDSETLYTVISTLQNLQTQGKTVGVISHVDGIQKRIKTRIEMVKKPNGLSKLKKIA